jgi:hypothetical protein
LADGAWTSAPVTTPAPMTARSAPPAIEVRRRVIACWFSSLFVRLRGKDPNPDCLVQSTQTTNEAPWKHASLGQSHSRHLVGCRAVASAPLTRLAEPFRAGLRKSPFVGHAPAFADPVEVSVAARDVPAAAESLYSTRSSSGVTRRRGSRSWNRPKQPSRQAAASVASRRGEAWEAPGRSARHPGSTG